jgi:hypothetical protein
MTQQINPDAIPSANLPVIPDKVAEALQRGEDVPLEAISETAAALKDAREADRSRPLHSETLRPITRAYANTIMTGNPQGTLSRGTLPRAPSTRRVIPPPFRRERISIRVPGEPQPQWRNVRAGDVQAGWIVPGVGRVVSVLRTTRHAAAADQVPVFREELQVQGYTGEDAAHLQGMYGHTRVAVGIDITLTGPEGASVTVDTMAEVQAFGLMPEPGTT